LATLAMPKVRAEDPQHDQAQPADA
jgi:hypothetical protein